MTTHHGSATFEFGDRTVTILRSFDAPMSLVFDALTKPEHVRQWFPADNAPLHTCEIDLRVGGSYHKAWDGPGGVECSFRGTFLEIERPTRIVSTWLFEGWPDDEAIETVTLTEDEGVTTMKDVFEFTAPENLGDHFQTSAGVQSSWDKLDDLLSMMQVGVSVWRDIDAPAGELFAYLARPAHHASIDGTGMLKGTHDQQVLSAIGDVFEMNMYNDQMGDYVMENHVVEFEVDRRIAWEPVMKATDKSQFESRIGDRAHHRWGWDLSARPEGGTRVTEFYDLSAAPEWLHTATKEGEDWRSGMQASLANLAKLAERPS